MAGTLARFCETPAKASMLRANVRGACAVQNVILVSASQPVWVALNLIAAGAEA
jgi:hypothetical protein